LHRINVLLHKNNLRIIAQIHSHPNEAYHSEADDASPIVATIGGVSIVVPRFAADPINLENWAIYRLSPDKRWEQLSSAEVRKTITISDELQWV